MDEELENFFADRTLGFATLFSGFHWRGPGYDDGWEWDIPRQDLVELHRLLGEYLEQVVE